MGLERGADASLTTPFSIQELIAGVQGLFRRLEALRSQAAPEGEEISRVGDLGTS